MENFLKSHFSVILKCFILICCLRIIRVQHECLHVYVCGLNLDVRLPGGRGPGGGQRGSLICVRTHDKQRSVATAACLVHSD